MTKRGAGEVPYLLPLSPSQFREALRKGHGRAVLHARAHGLNSLRDELIDALVHDDRYDRQCEPDRIAWLLELVRIAPNQRVIEQRVLSALTESDNEQDHGHSVSVTAGLCRLGLSDAERALSMEFEKGIARFRDRAQSEFDTKCVASLGCGLVEARGRRGLVEVARSFAPLMDRLNDQWKTVYWCGVSVLGRRSAVGALRGAARSDRSIRSCAQHAVRERKSFWRLGSRRMTAARTPLNFQQVKELVESPARDWRPRLRRLGRSADARVVDSVYEELLVEPDVAKRLRYLWFFHERLLPRVDPMLIEWAERADDAPLRRLTINALSNCTDEQVRTLAWRLLHRGDGATLEYGAVSLLTRNYQPGDASALTLSIRAATKPDELHPAIQDALEVAEHNPDPNLAPLLLWGYEATPCTLCRLRILEQLLSLDAAPDWMLDEARFDCDPTIRWLATEWGVQPAVRH